MRRRTSGPLGPWRSLSTTPRTTRHRHATFGSRVGSLPLPLSMAPSPPSLPSPCLLPRPFPALLGLPPCPSRFPDAPRFSCFPSPLGRDRLPCSPLLPSPRSRRSDAGWPQRTVEEGTENGQNTEGGLFLLKLPPSPSQVARFSLPQAPFRSFLGLHCPLNQPFHGLPLQRPLPPCSLEDAHFPFCSASTRRGRLQVGREDHSAGRRARDDPRTPSLHAELWLQQEGASRRQRWTLRHWRQVRYQAFPLPPHSAPPCLLFPSLFPPPRTPAPTPQFSALLPHPPCGWIVQLDDG